MFQINVPKYFWGDVVLTTRFLINRMPFTLASETSFKCLFPNSHMFEITSRIFGCVCFVHFVNTSMDKLSSRSIRCIFLGYSET